MSHQPCGAHPVDRYDYVKGVAVKPLHLFTLAQTLSLVILYVLTRLKDVSVVFPFFIGMHAMQQQSAAAASAKIQWQQLAQAASGSSRIEVRDCSERQRRGIAVRGSGRQ